MFRFILLSTFFCLVGGQVQENQVDAVSTSSSSFDAYLEDFGKTYGENQDEYAKRYLIFQQNLAAIEHHNNNRKEGQSYTLGINQFSDMLPEDVPKGYTKAASYHWSHTATGRRSLQHVTTDLESIIHTEPVSKLPKHVDWRAKGITTPVKNQYYCGSCWAFASTAVVESHVARATGVLFSLSEQQLVSCASNPFHCGGTGGCAGSTAEIAMEHVRTHGMVDEWAFGYESNHGANISCTLPERQTSFIRGSRGSNQDTDNNNDKHYLKGAVATIEGWMTLPRNNYTAVMNSVAKLGPLAVSVACSPWVSYKSGIYSGSLKSRKETDVSVPSHRQNYVRFLQMYSQTSCLGADQSLGGSGRLRDR